jgi:hypothetical protein
MFYDDTAMIRMLIDEIAEQRAVPLEEALMLFYTSPLAKEISNRDSWYQTYSPSDLAKDLELNILRS